MIELDTARTAALRELNSFIALCGAMRDEDWSLPTRCVGWTVRDLVEHVAGVPRFYAAVARRARLSTGEPVSYSAVSGTAAHLVDILREGLTEFETELAALTETDLDRQLFPGESDALPVRRALALYVLEFGVHRNDLEWALGDAADLANDVCAGIATFCETDVPFATTPAVAGDVSYVLVGETVTWAFSSSGRAWKSGAGHARCCTVRGSDSAICLLMCGRISTHDERLSVTEGFDPIVFHCL